MHGLEGSPYESDSDNSIKAIDGHEHSFFATKRGGKLSKKHDSGHQGISSEKLRAKFVMKVNHFAANSPGRVMPQAIVFGLKKSVGGGGMGN